MHLLDSKVQVIIVFIFNMIKYEKKFSQRKIKQSKTQYYYYYYYYLGFSYL